MKTANILSIDAWRESNQGWSWDDWHTVGTITKEEFETLTTNRKILRYMRDEGYLNESSKGLCCVDDDQYNIVICEKSTGRPLYAIEYGPLYN